MNDKKVFCIIVTYNAMKWIDKCLESLRKSKEAAMPVIIDNGSTDDTREHIKKYYPEVYLIVNNENKGFGQANNQGIEYAYKMGATHFFLLNQDAWVKEDTISKLIEVQDQNNLDVVSPIQLNGAGDSLDSSFCRAAFFNTKNVGLITDLLLKSVKEYYMVTSVPAACWMIARSTIEEIGGFDPLYFHYGEDSHYCQRLKFHNKKIAIVTNSYMHHDRFVKGNIQIFNKLEMIRSLYMEYADINKKGCRLNINRLKLHVYLILYFLKSILTLDKELLSNTLWSTNQFYGNLLKIRYSRKENKQVKPNWLNIKM